MNIKLITMLLIAGAAVLFSNCKKEPSPPVPQIAGKVFFNSLSNAGQLTIWNLDENGNILDSITYGPFAGWYIINYDDHQILWSTSGPGVHKISIWIMDDHGNQTTYKEYEGGFDWLPVQFSDGKILWQKPGGAAALWTVDDNGNIVDKDDYYLGSYWYPCSYDKGKILWKHSDYNNQSGEANISILDDTGNIIDSKYYGPFYGWGLVTYRAMSDNTILWHTFNEDNTGISLWTIDAKGNQITYKEYYGSFDEIFPGEYTDGKLLIKYDDGVNFSLWTMDANGNKLQSRDYKAPNGLYVRHYVK